MTFTPRPVTASDYAAACALAATEQRSSARDTAAAAVARSVVGDTCPRCAATFTAANPAEFCHYAPSAARVSSTGAWFGSTACRKCNLADDVARDMLSLNASEPMPFAYVVANFHVPADFGSRADIIRMAAALPTETPSRTDADVIERARQAVARMAR